MPITEHPVIIAILKEIKKDLERQEKLTERIK